MPNLRQDSFMFLRKNPVNLRRYLPNFLFNDVSFANVQNALNLEHENYRLKLIETARQLFYQTADSGGISDWELFLKIPNIRSKELELRRAIVETKLLRNTVMTVDNTKKLMRDFLRFESDDTVVDVEELGNNEIKLIILNGDFYWEELFDALFEWLPAHLVFGFGTYEDFGDEIIHYAQATAAVENSLFELDMLSPPPLDIGVKICVAEVGKTTLDIGSAVLRDEGKINAAIFEQQAINVTIACDRGELDNEETRADFERYLRQRWAEFKQNPVVQHYSHGTHGDIWDGELEPGDEEIFPVDVDFLRVYWSFPCGDDKWHLRYQTIAKPRPDLKAADINYLSAVGVSSQMLLHSKRDIPTTGIIRALYIRKTDIKVI